MSSITDLFICIDAYAEAKKLKESSISTFLFNDGKRLKRIREGADIGTRLLERAIQNLSDNWPADTAWPEGIARPAPTGSQP